MMPLLRFTLTIKDIISSAFYKNLFFKIPNHFNKVRITITSNNPIEAGAFSVVIFARKYSFPKNITTTTSDKLCFINSEPIVYDIPLEKIECVNEVELEFNKLILNDDDVIIIEIEDITKERL